MDIKYPHTHNIKFYLKMISNDNNHSECNPDSIIHNGNYLNQLGCIHNNPNDQNTENALYVWSIKNKQWKRIRYWKNHNFCKYNKECVYWDDDYDNDINNNNQKCTVIK